MPQDRVSKALSKVKSFGVVDRNVSFGWDTGIVYQEIKAALYEGNNKVPSVPFIAGLGGEDISVEMLMDAISLVVSAALGGKSSECIWLMKEEA